MTSLHRTSFAQPRLWIAALAFALTLAAQSQGAKQGQKTGAPLDLNRASETELMHLPGMTATWAARIVRFRPYRTKLDLIDKGVLTPEVYQRIRDAVVAHRTEK